MSRVEMIAPVDRVAGTNDRSLASSIALAAATVGAGLFAGLFYTFQVGLIPGLAEVDDVAYVTTFQAINDRIVENPWFQIVFSGTPLLIAGALVLNRRAARPVAPLIAAGLALNVVVIAITAFGNIPLNDDLAGYTNVTAETARTARADFEDRWNRLHLARTLVSVAGFVSLTVASILSDRR
ncbi:MAG: DUF1772 domain-containing protein [Thermomicrobiales bacterium]